LCSSWSRASSNSRCQALGKLLPSMFARSLARAWDCWEWSLVNLQHVRSLVLASPNQSVNSVFLSQQTSTSQHKLAQKLTSEHAVCMRCREVRCMLIIYCYACTYIHCCRCSRGIDPCLSNCVLGGLSNLR